MSIESLNEHQASVYRFGGSLQTRNSLSSLTSFTASDYALRVRGALT